DQAVSFNPHEQASIKNVSDPGPSGSRPAGKPPVADAGAELPPAEPASVDTAPQAETPTPKPLEDIQPEEALDATDRVTQQLQDYAKNRKEQESLLSTQRKAQAARLDAAIADDTGNDAERLIRMKEALKGKIERPDLPSIRDQLSPEDVNGLQARIL